MAIKKFNEMISDNSRVHELVSNWLAMDIYNPNNEEYALVSFIEDNGEQIVYDTLRELTTNDDMNTVDQHFAALEALIFENFGDESNLSESVSDETILLSKNPDDINSIDIDFVGSKSDIKNAAKQFNVTITKGKGQGHDLKGKKKDILKYLQSEYYDIEPDDIKEFYPKLLESVSDEDGKKFLSIEEPNEKAKFLMGLYNNGIVPAEDMNHNAFNDQDLGDKIENAFIELTDKGLIRFEDQDGDVHEVNESNKNIKTKQKMGLSKFKDFSINEAKKDKDVKKELKTDISRGTNSIAANLEKFIGKMGDLAVSEIKDKFKNIVEDKKVAASDATRKKWLAVADKEKSKVKLMSAITNLYLKAAKMGL